LLQHELFESWAQALAPSADFDAQQAAFLSVAGFCVSAEATPATRKARPITRASKDLFMTLSPSPQGDYRPRHCAAVSVF
jgi:hypothetical protein